MMTVSIIRHGATAGNLKRRYIGSTDEPLLPDADIQPPDWADGVARVYVSPLLRARETASKMFPGAAIVIREGLREMDFGDFENRSADEMADDAAYRAWVDSMCEDACPNGESKEGFIERTCAEFERIIADARAAGESEVVIVAHGGTVMAVMSRYALPERGYYDWGVKNLHGWRAEVLCDAGMLSLTGCEPI